MSSIIITHTNTAILHMTRLLSFLVYIISIYSKVAFSLNGLILGDSVDRLAVLDWCEHYQQQAQPWTDNNLIYDDKQQKAIFGGYYCHVEKLNVSIANLMFHGTNANGPYHFDYYLRVPGNIVDTKPRIAHAIPLYCAQFPAPDFIVLHTTMWDIRYRRRDEQSIVTWMQIRQNETSLLQLLLDFRKELTARVNEIRSLYTDHCASAARSAGGKKVPIILRSDVVVQQNFNSNSCKSDPDPDFKEQILLFNEAQRVVAQELNLSFYDLHRDVWSRFNFQYQSNQTNCHLVQRDFLHPTVDTLVLYAEKLLGLQYTQVYELRDGLDALLPPLFPPLSICSSSDNKQSMLVRRVLAMQLPKHVGSGSGGSNRGQPVPLPHNNSKTISGESGNDYYYLESMITFLHHDTSNKRQAVVASNIAPPLLLFLLYTTNNKKRLLRRRKLMKQQQPKGEQSITVWQTSNIL